MSNWHNWQHLVPDVDVVFGPRRRIQLFRCTVTGELWMPLRDLQHIGRQIQQALMRGDSCERMPASSVQRLGLGTIPLTMAPATAVLEVSRMAHGRVLEFCRWLFHHRAALGQPITRSECEQGPRPCPRVLCRHHLLFDIKGRGATAQDLASMPESCCLDLVARHPDGMALQEIGDVLRLTRERARQHEEDALARLQKMQTAGIQEWLP